jgi:predicted PhzF superfamily epimerase YddE/YHI9
MLVLDGEAEIHAVQPPYEALLKAEIGYPIKKLIVSALSSSKYDIISRCFCPWIGIDEDSVSAASHVLIGTYWSKRLDKQDLFAYQASYRSGELYITIDTTHTVIRGHTVIVLSGELHQLPMI